MRIVDRATFLTLSKGTVYAKYEPCWFGDLDIKDDTLSLVAPGDWFYQDIVNAIDSTGGFDFAEQLDDSLANGSSVRMDFDGLGRDGLFEADQLFAVWEPQDVRGLIHRLHRALADVEGTSSEVTPIPVDPRLIQAIYQCVRCDRRIAIPDGETVGTCSYCGSRVEITITSGG